MDMDEMHDQALDRCIQEFEEETYETSPGDDPVYGAVERGMCRVEPMPQVRVSCSPDSRSDSRPASEVRFADVTVVGHKILSEGSMSDWLVYGHYGVSVTHRPPQPDKQLDEPEYYVDIISKNYLEARVK